MKKLFTILTILIFTACQPVMAKCIKVEALSDFSTEKPPETWAVKVIHGFTMKSGEVVPEGAIIKGYITNITNPKRLKRDASFNFIVFEYDNPNNGKKITIDKKIVGKYSSLSDVSARGVIEKAAVTAGNQLVGAYVGPGYALVKGVVENEEGNRAKSAVVSVYESTPLSYASKGKQLEFKKGDTFVMSFKVKDDEDKASNETDISDKADEGEDNSDIEIIKNSNNPEPEKEVIKNEI